jgi:hypothetical protein
VKLSCQTEVATALLGYRARQGCRRDFGPVQLSIVRAARFAFAPSEAEEGLCCSRWSRDSVRVVELGDSLPCIQKPNFAPVFRQMTADHILTLHCLELLFNIILPSTPEFLTLHSKFSNRNFSSMSRMRAACLAHHSATS